MDEQIQNRIAKYQIPEHALERLRPIKTVILVGITAAGKDTIIRDILNETEQFKRVVTSTTRAPRENNGVMEQEGVNYYFLNLDQAQQKMDNGEYIEVANVHGRVNGSLVAEYERIAGMGKIALSDIDYQGVLNFLKFGMDNLHVYFIVPPSFEVWLARLAKRQGGVMERDEELITRFRSAKDELESARNNPQLIPVMNLKSDETARDIINYTLNDTEPSDEARAKALAVIDELDAAIANYIDQIESEIA